MVPGKDELLLIRHAPADHGGRLTGRSDVPALLPPEAGIMPLRGFLAGCRVVSSPARRCQMTAGLLFPGQPIPTDPRLWEQDFGAQEGCAFADLPDLGALDRAALAQHRFEGGESYAAMALRAVAALRDLADGNGPVAVVAHAGTVRAALGLALGEVALGLAFEVAPLSLTRLRCLPSGFAIVATNWHAG